MPTSPVYEHRLYGSPLTPASPIRHTLVDPQSDMPPNANVKILDHMGQRPKFKRSSSRGLISNGGIDTTNEWGTAEEAIGEAAKARRQSFYGIMSHPDLKEKDTFNKPKHGPWCKMKRIITKVIRFVATPFTKRLQKQKKVDAQKRRETYDSQVHQVAERARAERVARDASLDDSEAFSEEESEDETVAEVDNKVELEAETESELVRPSDLEVPEMYERKMHEKRSWVTV